MDAACGTGRYTGYLVERGHRVIGVDSSPDMLVRARERVLGAEFRLGDLHQLPLPDDHVDIVLYALALTHVPDLKPVFAELVRVLRRYRHRTMDYWPWSLLDVVPAAHSAAFNETPVTIIWHFQLADR